MRYRILTVTFESGGKNYFAQKLTFAGYKTLKGNNGFAVYTEYEKAEEHIRKLKAKKFETKYIW